MNIEILNFLKLQESTDGNNARKILLLAGYDKECRVCGSVFYVQAHHKDRNRCNNKITNLEFRCISCHKYIHKQYPKSLIDKAFKIKKFNSSSTYRRNIFKVKNGKYIHNYQ